MIKSVISIFGIKLNNLVSIRTKQALFRIIIILIVFVNKCQCCITDHPLLIVQPQQQQHIRMLQQSEPHNFHIYGHFPQTTQHSIDIGLLKNIFGIASKYFEHTLQVTNLPKKMTYYPYKSIECGVSVPETFVIAGFDQQVTDMVVFIAITHDTFKSYVAAAAPCIKLRRPIYGFIIYNAAHIQSNIGSFGLYHANIYVSIHELTHILGLNPNYFSQFYVSSISSTKFKIQQVVKKNGLRNMIITPNVRHYVSNYFQCFDNSIGALLQDQGSSGSIDSHWQRKVYFNELMTASTFLSGLKVSGLTLSLLKDTGFYHSVNLNLAQTLHFGRNKGCNFALGLTQPLPQFSCNSTCDFYNVYGGQCSKSDPFANQATYLRPYSNFVCSLSSHSTSSMVESGLVFSPTSRCFNVKALFSSQQPHCYKVQCKQSNKIQITIAGSKHICDPSKSQIITLNGIVRCPTNYESFCSVKTCENWCHSHGVCINGQCICKPPFHGISCLQGCPKYFDYESNECVEQCGSKAIFNKGCISKCPPTYKIGNNNNCVKCQFFEVCWDKRFSISLLILVFVLFQ